MAGVIDHGTNGGASDNSVRPVVRVGNGSALVSIKDYQDIYHQITGRTEQIRRRYKENFLVDMSELQQLHYKITQLCDVHEIVASNEAISIFHNKERKEQFTSFERFTKYNSNAVSPTVSVNLKYNLSIVLPGQQKPQEYTVSIRISSRVALLKELEEEAPPFMRGQMLGYIAGNTAEVTIDYADYVVARGFLEAFDEWAIGCKKNPRLKWIEFCAAWSYILPGSFRVISVIFILFFALNAIPTYFGADSTPQIAARFFVVYSLGTLVLTGLMRSVGRVVERAIDSYPTLSYLNLNKGDEKLIAEFGERRRFVVIRFIVGCLLAIALNILAAKLDKLI